MQELATQIKKIVAQLIAHLPPRNREIITRRFGLKTGAKETLESIGASHSITRERIRQIEASAIVQIKNSLSPEVTKPFVLAVRNIIERAGGVIREDTLFNEFSGVPKRDPANMALAFMLTLSGEYLRSPEDEDFYAFWSLSKDHTNRFKSTVQDFINGLEKRNAVVQETNADVPREELSSYLAISKQVSKNVFGAIGLTKWADIKPRGVRDKSFLILKREGQPRHFRDITNLINTVGFDNRKAHVQTVHNELIKDRRFVLVGRGIYGLAEWGFEPGTVKEVIANFIRTAGPQSKDKIIAHVMSARMVKPNTIILGMQDRNLFRENDHGHIALKDA